MKIARTAQAAITRTRQEIISRFVTVSALAGLLMGVLEAFLLRTSPRIEALLIPDTGYVEWFLAPLLDMACFGLIGLLLGWLAARKPGKNRTAMLVAVDAAALVMFVALRLRWLHTRVVIKEFAFRIDILIPLAWFVAGFAASLLAAYLLWKPVSNLASRSRFRVVPFLSWGLALAGLVAISGVGTFLVRPLPNSAPMGPGSATRSGSPNVVFIVLDTVRADHLSSYGYSRRTTPNLDRLARAGVLFENAIAPTSWTLASHASMFTGLLPHQHGADWASPLPLDPRTLADVLRSRGYETAGFVANFNYCQKGWGIDRGFETYVDDSESLRRNLAGTLLGTSLIQPVYQHFCRFDYLERQDAREINEEVFGWFRRRSTLPFFLFVNYFDCHTPYLTEPPYDHRFGKISDKLVHKLFNALQSKDPARGFTATEQASLVAGYDDCLAFLDEHVGRLLDLLRESPEGRNTIVIITSDHGEAFGEQGWYSHGYNLYREVLHVPLIITGPGIPKDVRIRRLVRTRDLFSTVLDLATGGKTPFSRHSLARFWNPQFTPQPFDDFAVSELVPIFNEGGKDAMISLTTPEWQYIYNSSGRQELYHWTTDPRDQTDLAGSAGAQTTLESFRKHLIRIVADSSEPWRGPNYLFARSVTGSSFLPEVISAKRPDQTFLAGNRLFIGASQALFESEEPLIPVRPAPPDQDSLKSLPYH
jgi:arylsulfatase A-like enzyme